MLVLVCWADLTGASPTVTFANVDEPALTVKPPHAWRPPFGLDRVEAGRDAVITFAQSPDGKWSIEQYRRAKSLGAAQVDAPTVAPFVAHIRLHALCDEVALFHTESNGSNREVARAKVDAPPVAVEAVAHTLPVVNPVDLGTILLPTGSVAIGPDSRVFVDVALFSRSGDHADLQVSAWFESGGDKRIEAVSLRDGKRAAVKIELPKHAMSSSRDTLHVEVSGITGEETWRREFPVMVVAKPPELPKFGATRIKLRYDAPISIRDPKTGTFSTLDYVKGWDSSLDDVVVSLPNGARFVFWRGSSYIPFWASRGNTGLCTEWAEEITRRPGAIDCVEPLMDKELRYGRVEIVESTPSHVHVRWTYQSTDLLYQTWGDFAVEDYHFYPDGFGTRVLTLTADPNAEYELSEFIVLTPLGAYPLDVLPEALIDVLLSDGSKHALRFPLDEKVAAGLRVQTAWPAIYRVRLNRTDPETGIYFHPDDLEMPPIVFGPFYDGGQLVTPGYWGSHWPLARGNATGSTIDPRISATPSHNSMLSWAKHKPKPFAEKRGETRDALGRTHDMVTRSWAWLIGMTDVDDARVRQFAASYANPPRLVIEGGTRIADHSAIERRAIGVGDAGSTLTLRVDGNTAWVRPIVEIRGGRKALAGVNVRGEAVDPDRYAWDGNTLWLDADVAPGETLELRLKEPGA